jgi:DNA-binding NarL/FixJ family response regulator
MRVLVMDAGPGSQNELRQAVTSLGYDTIGTRDVTGSLVRFSEWRPDAIICREEPGSGKARVLLDRLRAVETLSYCYALVVGEFDHAASLALIEAGADDVLRDPPGHLLELRLLVARRLRRRLRTIATPPPTSEPRELVAPVAKPEPFEPVPGPSRAPRTGPIRLIIADDDAIARAAFEGILSADPDLEVVAVARDAEEAIALARTHRPEVVLLDYSMPAGGGVRAAAEIGGSDPWVHLIGTSGDASPKVRTEMLGMGCRVVVTKAADPAELLQATHVRVVEGG